MADKITQETVHGNSEISEKNEAEEAVTQKETPPVSRKTGGFASFVSVIALGVSLCALSAPYWQEPVLSLLQQAGISVPETGVTEGDETESALMREEAQKSAQIQEGILAEIKELQKNVADLSTQIPDEGGEEPDLKALLQPLVQVEAEKLIRKNDQFQDQLRQDLEQQKATKQGLTRDLMHLTDRLEGVSQDVTHLQSGLNSQQDHARSQAGQTDQTLRSYKNIVADLQRQQSQLHQTLTALQTKVSEADGQKWSQQMTRLALAISLQQGVSYKAYLPFIALPDSGLQPDQQEFLQRQAHIRLPSLFQVQFAYLRLRPKLQELVVRPSGALPARHREAEETVSWWSQAWRRATSLIHIEKIDLDGTGSLESPTDFTAGMPQDIAVLKHLDQAVAEGDWQKIQQYGEIFLKRFDVLAPTLGNWQEMVQQAAQAFKIHSDLLALQTSAQIPSSDFSEENGI